MVSPKPHPPPVPHADRRHGQWVWRRLLIFMCAALSGGILINLTWYGQQDGKLHLLIAEGCFWLLGSLVAVYVAGATAQDIVSFVRGVRGIQDQAKESK